MTNKLKPRLHFRITCIAFEGCADTTGSCSIQRWRLWTLVNLFSLRIVARNANSTFLVRSEGGVQVALCHWGAVPHHGPAGAWTWSKPSSYA